MIEINHGKVQSFIVNSQEGRSISRQNLNANLEFLHLARTQFYHYISGFNPKTGFLRNHLCLGPIVA